MRYSHHSIGPRDAAEIEQLGYGALWLSRSPAAPLALVEPLLAATQSLVVGTDIINIWSAPAAEVAKSFSRINAAYPDRFILGIGVGHREFQSNYQKPLDALGAYLDALDAAHVPMNRRALAALGPRVLGLARDRAAGALPYFVTPEHTRRAREILGAAFLSVGQNVVLESDPRRAREIARPTANMYLGLKNYTANLRRLGFADNELVIPATDTLVDSLIAHGDVDQIASRLREHLDSGADQVGVVVQSPDSSILPSLRALAPALTT